MLHTQHSILHTHLTHARMQSKHTNVSTLVAFTSSHRDIIATGVFVKQIATFRHYKLHARFDYVCIDVDQWTGSRNHYKYTPIELSILSTHKGRLTHTAHTSFKQTDVHTELPKLCAFVVDVVDVGRTFIYYLTHASSRDVVATFQRRTDRMDRGIK